MLAGPVTGLANRRAGAIAVVAVTATAATAVLFRPRRLTQPVAHSILGVAPAVVAGLTLQADGGVDSAAFAFLNEFGTAYAAMFFSRRALTGPVILSRTTSGVALSATDLGNKENSYFAVVLALPMSTMAVLLSRLMRQIWTAATHDTVTSLLNEAGLRPPSPADRLLLVCDINRFARINHALGRDAGDDLLRDVTQSLARLWPDATLARISVDVFAWALATMVCVFPKRGWEARRFPAVNAYARAVGPNGGRFVLRHRAVGESEHREHDSTMSDACCRTWGSLSCSISYGSAVLTPMPDAPTSQTRDRLVPRTLPAEA